MTYKSLVNTRGGGGVAGPSVGETGGLPQSGQRPSEGLGRKLAVDCFTLLLARHLSWVVCFMREGISVVEQIKGADMMSSQDILSQWQRRFEMKSAALHYVTKFSKRNQINLRVKFETLPSGI